MALLLNRDNVNFEIYVPIDGSWRRFRGGKLEITDEDPAYAIVLAEAQGNPSIEIFMETSDADEPAKKVTRRAKAKGGISCDACKPVQMFDTQDELQEHLKLVHMALPKMDNEGNEIGRRDEEDEAPVLSVPAAKRRG